MYQKIVLNEKDIEEIIAEKFNVNKICVHIYRSTTTIGGGTMYEEEVPCIRADIIKSIEQH